MSYREHIYRALDNLRARNPMGYAQLVTQPFHHPAAYVEDDPNHAWWSSQEAADFLEMIKAGAHEGVKAGGRPRIRIRSTVGTPDSKMQFGFDDSRAARVAANLLEDDLFEAKRKPKPSEDIDPKAWVMQKMPKYKKPDPCDECGEDVDEHGGGMSCPDGAYICYDCFDAGLH